MIIHQSDRNGRVGACLLLLLTFLVSGGLSLTTGPLFSIRSIKATGQLSSVAVPVEELEKDLTAGERSVTGVVRKCGPSVAFVTSVLPLNQTGRQRRRSRTPRDSTPPSNLPRGQSLGSGSGFVVDGSGYICTNYHVIEGAYSILDMAKQANQTAEFLKGNATAFGLPADLVENVFTSLQQAVPERMLPNVFVRISTDKKYLPCRIVSVEPDLDLAVLKVSDKNDNGTVLASTPSISFGSSSELIVGQTVVAIGNPFGLDNTVTAGVVSALNRDFNPNRRGQPIRDCIQTDAAINPGNSGGPLLNLRGQVVGINTAIITTSGSNAGIGFAVPSDQLRPVVDRMILQDRVENGERPNKGYLGVSIIDFPKPKEDTFNEDGKTKSKSIAASKNWVTKVAPGSPASEAGIKPTTIDEFGNIKFGDAIVIIGDNEVLTFDELQAELGGRVEGENVAITLEDQTGERRVVYTKLRKRES